MLALKNNSKANLMAFFRPSLIDLATSLAEARVEQEREWEHIILENHK